MPAVWFACRQHRYSITTSSHVPVAPHDCSKRPHAGKRLRGYEAGGRAGSRKTAERMKRWVKECSSAGGNEKSTVREGSGGTCLGSMVQGSLGDRSVSVWLQAVDVWLASRCKPRIWAWRRRWLWLLVPCKSGATHDEVEKFANPARIVGRGHNVGMPISLRKNSFTTKMTVVIGPCRAHCAPQPLKRPRTPCQEGPGGRGEGSTRHTG